MAVTSLSPVVVIASWGEVKWGAPEINREIISTRFDSSFFMHKQRRSSWHFHSPQVTCHSLAHQSWSMITPGQVARKSQRYLAAPWPTYFLFSTFCSTRFGPICVAVSPHMWPWVSDEGDGDGDGDGTGFKVASNQFRALKFAPTKVRLRRASIKIFIGQAGYIFILAGHNVTHCRASCSA